MDKENASKLNELDESIPDRDFDFEKDKTDELYASYVSRFVDKINLLKNDEDFVSDPSFNGVKASHHIMYKYKVNGKGETLLLTPDGHIGYEFLVEFDKGNPEYGIYYGCRGHIKEGDQEEGIKRIEEDWIEVKGEVIAVLNDTFVDKDFSKRWQLTNNANNKTYWPFWISLGADEDVIKVADRATKLICNVYKKYIDGWQPSRKWTEDDDGKPIPVRTKYTEEAWDDICELIKKTKGGMVVQKFQSFITKMENNGIIEKDDRYEKCWKFKKYNKTEAYCLIKEFCNDINIKSSIPWAWFTPLFLSNQDKCFDDNIKKMKPYPDTKDKMFEVYKKLDV